MPLVSRPSFPSIGLLLLLLLPLLLLLQERLSLWPLLEFVEEVLLPSLLAGDPIDLVRRPAPSLHCSALVYGSVGVLLFLCSRALSSLFQFAAAAEPGGDRPLIRRVGCDAAYPQLRAASTSMQRAP